jgi:hypothetical protein
VPSAGLEHALRLVRQRAEWRRTNGKEALARELELVAASLAADLATADTARLQTVRCPQCGCPVTVVRRRPTQ